MSKYPSSPRPLTRICPLLLLVACSHEAPDHRENTAPAAETPRFEPPSYRSELPAVRAARVAIEEGRVEDARAALKGVQEEIGVERWLLEARLAAILRDSTRVSQLIERARAAAPEDPRVYATSAELHAAEGRLETALAECQRGRETCGPRPELDRARGVQLICSSGGAEAGLGVLERALEHDPGLPFIRRPLCQAYRLVGQKRLGMGLGPEALRLARLAIEYGPEDLDARRLMAEAQIAVLDHAGAAASYRALVADGEPLKVELQTALKNAGIGALVQQDRAAAVEFFLEARATGMPDEDLATGRTVLESEARRLTEEARESADGGRMEEALAKLERALSCDPSCEPARIEMASFAVAEGVAALAEQSYELASARLERALELDPESIEARNYLGYVYVELGRPAEAARMWRWVLDTARVEDLELPEPVHLSLARAYSLAGDLGQSRSTLQEYLDLEPQGEYVQQTRQLLAALPKGDSDGR